MNHEENRSDEFLREMLQGHPPLSPPSADYREQVMRRVTVAPVGRRSSNMLTIGSILLALVTALLGGLLLNIYATDILLIISRALRWLPWQIDPRWVMVGLVYVTIARALLTLGVLITVDHKRVLLSSPFA